MIQMHLTKTKKKYYFQSYPDIEKKVAIVNEQNMVKEETRQKITTYLKLRDLDKVDKMGTTVADRSMFFLNHINEDFINALKVLLQKENDVDKKYEELVKELETMWECKVCDFIIPGKKSFECFVDFEQFTVFLVANEHELKQEVVGYFCEMLDIKCH